MNVLHLISGRGPTGAAAAALADIRALRAAGHNVWAACRNSAAIVDALKSAGLDDSQIVRGMHFNRGALGVLTLPRDLRLLSRTVRQCGIEVVHAHRGDEQWIASLVLSLRKAVLIRTWHRNPEGVSRTVRKALVRTAAGTVCVSREHAAILQKGSTARVRYIPPAIDTDAFASSLRRTEIVIGQMARWKREKGRDRGQRFALEVLHRLAGDPALAHLRVRGEIIGRGEMGTELQRYAFEELGLSADCVRFVDTTEMPPAGFARHLATLSLGLVLCVGNDGASRPALEMLSCGVPLLIADIPGLRELAEDSSAVVSMPDRKTESWANFIRALLLEPGKLERMSHAARNQAQDRNSLSVRGRELAEFYGACMDSQ